MFSATMVLLSGEIIQGVIMISVMAYFAASYMILSRNGNRYPTDLCVAGCILCAIATDVLWGFFNFGPSPLLTVTTDPGPATKLYYEAMVAGVICFSGLIITNIIRNKRFKITKIILFVLFAENIVLILVNIVKIGSLSLSFTFPGTNSLGTIIILICTACLLIIVLGILALASLGLKSKINALTALLLAFLTVAAGAAGIYKSVKDQRAGYLYDQRSEYNISITDHTDRG